MLPKLLLTAALTFAVPAFATAFTEIDTLSAGRAPLGGKSPQLDKRVTREYVRADGAAGYLYRPAQPSPKSRTALLVMHYAADYTTLSVCGEMAQRGYSVLCMKNSGGTLDERLLDVYASMQYLRSRIDVSQIVLWGHSGGATLLSAYQMIAENGVQSCQGTEKIHPCPDYLQGMPKADGVIWADSNWGNAVMTVLSLDPAVKVQDNGLQIDQAFNLYNPANGFNSQGNSNYPATFIQRFQAGVAQRNNALLNDAQIRLKNIEAGKDQFTDDAPFVVAGAGSTGPNNKLFLQDTRLLARTKGQWPLIHKGGTQTVQIVHSVRPPRPISGLTARLNLGAANTTVRGWLTDNAIRVNRNFSYDAEGVYGVDWTSTYAATAGNVTQIRVPSLILGMTGGYEFLAAELLYNQSPAKDKRLAFIEGATHMYDTCAACEKTPGQFGNTLTTLFDYADKWLAAKERFNTHPGK